MSDSRHFSGHPGRVSGLEVVLTLPGTLSVLEVTHRLRVFLTQHLADGVSVARCVTKLEGELDDLLLVDDDAQRLRQNVVQDGMLSPRVLKAVTAAYVGFCGP